MHLVVWTVSDQRFAVETGSVIEVVAVVDVRRIPHGPAWIRGFMDYRGTLIPLLDVRSLLGRGETALRRVCRILVVRTNDGLVGLLVESVESVEPGEPDAAHDGLALEDTPYLGPIVRTAAGTAQVVIPENLIQDEHRSILFSRTTEDPS